MCNYLHFQNYRAQHLKCAYIHGLSLYYHNKLPLNFVNRELSERERERELKKKKDDDDGDGKRVSRT